MNREYRKQLLSTLAKIEQLIAETEALTTEASDDEVLLGASTFLATLREQLANLERKLNNLDET